MGQLKAKTLIEKHGFLDADKKTPEHDKIQKWVYKNAYKVIDDLFVKGTETFEIKQNVWEHEIIETTQNYASSSKRVVGFIDLYVQYLKPSNKIELAWPEVYFEIKTSIPSVGELLRQLKYYQTFLGKRRFVVVSSDDSCADILQEQGFYFYKYQDSEKLF